MRISIVAASLTVLVLSTVSCSIQTPPTPAASMNYSPAVEATVAAPAPPVILGGPGLMPPGEPTGRQNVYSVQIDLVPLKPVYMPGETIAMDVTLTNASKGEVEQVIVSPLPPEVNLVPAGVFLGPAMPPGISAPGGGPGKPSKVFPAGTDEKNLAVGENVTYRLTWDQKDVSGNQVPPGWYFYESSFNFRPESSPTGSGSGVRNRAFLIQYPQGALQKTIEVNQSRTVTGLSLMVNGSTEPVDATITLKRVVLDDRGATFYATMNSPDNPVSGYSNEWQGRIPMSSQYIIDGVAKEARAPSSQFLATGIEFRWGASADDSNYLDPVPSDAKQLKFVIPEIGTDWQGPWEFDIPLK